MEAKLLVFLVGAVVAASSPLAPSLSTAVNNCTLPAEPGLCDASMPRWFFNVETGVCERFIYGGCGGNGNNFHSQQECQTTCLRLPTPTNRPHGVDFETGCRPAADPGVCDAYFPRWFFNVKTGSCETFIYGGCQGNENRYETRADCELACLRH